MQEKRNSIGVHIDKNALVDEGDGVIRFPNGLVITDNSEMWDGYSYDIESLGIEKWNKKVTVDHDRVVEKLVATAGNIVKRGNQVVIDSLRFAVKESAMARLTYDLMRGGFLSDASTETFGPWPSSNEKVYRDAQVCGLSLVVVGNNLNANANQLVTNSLAQAKQDGLDVAGLEQAFKTNEPPKPPKEANTKVNQEDDMKFVTIKNSRDFDVTVKYKNAAGEDTETDVKPGAGVDVGEDQKEAVENQIAGATASQPDVDAIVANKLAEARKEDEAKLAEVQNELAEFKEAFDKGVVEPAFRPAPKGEVRNRVGAANSKLADMDWRERVALQVHSNIAASHGDARAAETLRNINEFHAEGLLEAELITNALDLDNLDGFVIPREMEKTIRERVSNYTPLLQLFRFEETMSLDTAFLKGTGDITMEDVDMNDNGDNEDLKPISSPTFNTTTTSLKEFAAITPIKTSALRFSAVDLVQHITKLYKRAYDRALATSVIGRLEKAVEANGNSVPYNYSSGAGGDVEALVTLITAWSEVAEHTPNGVYTMTQKSYLHLLAMALRAGTNGPLANIFTNGPNDVPQFLSRPYAIVPSDLMPDLNTASTKSLVFEGTTATVNHGLFFADPDDFTGKVSGGLNFQVSDDAAYEIGGVTKSAWQRNEVVFRGSGYRASGLYFDEKVSGILAPGIS